MYVVLILKVKVKLSMYMSLGYTLGVKVWLHFLLTSALDEEQW